MISKARNIQNCIRKFSSISQESRRRRKMRNTQWNDRFHFEEAHTTEKSFIPQVMENMFCRLQFYDRSIIHDILSIFSSLIMFLFNLCIIVVGCCRFCCCRHRKNSPWCYAKLAVTPCVLRVLFTFLFSCNEYIHTIDICNLSFVLN